MTEIEAEKLGKEVITSLGLKLINGKVQTDSGTKTPLGVGRMIESYIKLLEKIK